MLQALFVALIVGFAVQAMGSKGEPVLNFVTVLQRLVFKILGGIMWLAPIGAFGAIAGVVGNAGWAAIGSLGMLVGVFYATCAVFVVVILGAMLKVTTGSQHLQGAVLPAPGVPADRRDLAPPRPRCPG